MGWGGNWWDGECGGMGELFPWRGSEKAITQRGQHQISENNTYSYVYRCTTCAERTEPSRGCTSVPCFHVQSHANSTEQKCACNARVPASASTEGACRVPAQQAHERCALKERHACAYHKKRTLRSSSRVPLNTNRSTPYYILRSQNPYEHGWETPLLLTQRTTRQQARASNPKTTATRPSPLPPSTSPLTLQSSARDARVSDAFHVCPRKPRVDALQEPPRLIHGGPRPPGIVRGARVGGSEGGEA